MKNLIVIGLLMSLFAQPSFAIGERSTQCDRSASQNRTENPHVAVTDHQEEEVRANASER